LGRRGVSCAETSVEGEPLVARHFAKSAKRAIDVLGQAADAHDHIHKRGICDVKADSVARSN